MLPSWEIKLVSRAFHVNPGYNVVLTSQIKAGFYPRLTSYRGDKVI